VGPPTTAARLEAAERQLEVFAREINQLYRAERRRTAELARATHELGAFQLASVEALVAAVEAWDPSIRAHLGRTQRYAGALVGAVDPALAADRRISYGFLLHDVGKLGVPAAILDKPGPLDAREWQVMQSHPLLGVRIVAGMPFLGPAVDVIGCHHERWDGRGYPNGLRGQEIPLAARVFSVCDAFDAMTSDRPYRRALPVERAVDELRAGAGTQFDPTVVAAFMAEVGPIVAMHDTLHQAAPAPASSAARG
jgi:HD-GYP domain-containing protein (c-di-GMP phosphodiesterase class II)